MENELHHIGRFFDINKAILNGLEINLMEMFKIVMHKLIYFSNQHIDKLQNKYFVYNKPFYYKVHRKNTIHQKKNRSHNKNPN